MQIKRSLLCVLALIFLAASASAQRGGGHGGFASHGSSSFHSGGFAPSSGFRSTSPGYVARGSIFATPGTRGAFRSYPTPRASVVSPIRPAFYGTNRGGRPFAGRRRPIVYATGYGYGYPGYIGTGYLDGPYLDDSSPEDASAAVGYDQPGPEQYADQVPVQGPYLDLPTQAQNTPSTAPQRPVAPPAASEFVTLVFKDGHTQQIQNFIATRSSISLIQGQRHFDVAVADLDMAATQKANRAAGVDFSLPGSAQ